MSYYVIVRGPLGVGKTTVSQKLATALRAEYISVDRMLEDHDIWYNGRLSEFLRVNVVVAKLADRLLKKGTTVVLDGNFYWKSQIRDLEKRLRGPHSVFTLKAPLQVCIERDAGRKAPHGRRAAREVYAKSTRFQHGVEVDATRPVQRIVRELVIAIRGATRAQNRQTRRYVRPGPIEGPRPRPWRTRGSQRSDVGQRRGWDP